MNQIFGHIEKEMSVKFPANLSEFAQSAIINAHTAYERHLALMREFNRRLLENASVNAEAAFGVAHKLAKAQNVNEAAKIHGEFLQAQAQRMLEQTGEVVSLTIEAGAKAIETWSSLFTAGRSISR